VCKYESEKNVRVFCNPSVMQNNNILELRREASGYLKYALQEFYLPKLKTAEKFKKK
jgi:hypothetical protein